MALQTTKSKHSSNQINNIILALFFSDPILNANSNDRATVQSLLERLILEEDQFDVHDILPNTVPDPASLVLESDYACPVGQVVQAPDCGKFDLKLVPYKHTLVSFIQVPKIST